MILLESTLWLPLIVATILILAADAYLAALAIEHGCELVSLDRDLARFERLR